MRSVCGVLDGNTNRRRSDNVTFSPHSLNTATAVPYSTLSNDTPFAVIILSFTLLYETNEKRQFGVGLASKFTRVLGKKICILHQLSFGRTRLQDVRHGYRRVAVGEMRIVSAAAHRDTEPVTGYAVHGDLMKFPNDAISILQQIIKKTRYYQPFGLGSSRFATIFSQINTS